MTSKAYFFKVNEIRYPNSVYTLTEKPAAEAAGSPFSHTKLWIKNRL